MKTAGVWVLVMVILSIGIYKMGENWKQEIDLKIIQERKIIASKTWKVFKSKPSRLIELTPVWVSRNSYSNPNIKLSFRCMERDLRPDFSIYITWDLEDDCLVGLDSITTDADMRFSGGKAIRGRISCESFVEVRSSDDNPQRRAYRMCFLHVMGPIFTRLVAKKEEFLIRWGGNEVIQFKLDSFPIEELSSCIGAA